MCIRVMWECIARSEIADLVEKCDVDERSEGLLVIVPHLATVLDLGHISY